MRCLKLYAKPNEYSFSYRGSIISWFWMRTGDKVSVYMWVLAWMLQEVKGGEMQSGYFIGQSNLSFIWGGTVWEK